MFIGWALAITKNCMMSKNNDDFQLLLCFDPRLTP